MTDKSEWPRWLKDANTDGAVVEIIDGCVIWLGGEWLGGEWLGGEWRGGVWLGGEWRGGEWRGGVWRGGEWRGAEDRLLLMAAMIGIVFDEDGVATAYRSTRHDASGRYNKSFKQVPGPFEIDNAAPSGAGTCVAGIHVTTAARAWTYFGVDKTARLWRVKFTREDLLDCDGEKARIRAGVAEEVPWPFFKGE